MGTTQRSYQYENRYLTTYLDSEKLEHHPAYAVAQLSCAFVFRKWKPEISREFAHFMIMLKTIFNFNQENTRNVLRIPSNGIVI